MTASVTEGVVLVTGASRGIGRHLVQHFLGQGRAWSARVAGRSTDRRSATHISSAMFPKRTRWPGAIGLADRCTWLWPAASSPTSA